MSTIVSQVIVALFLVTGGLTCAKPITGKYTVAGRSTIIHDDDDPRSKITGTLHVQRKSVRMQLLTIDESKEKNRCGWTVKFAPRLKNRPRRQKRKGQRNVSCGGSFDTRFTMRWTKRGRGYRITVQAQGIGITDSDGNLRASVSGSRS